MRTNSLDGTSLKQDTKMHSKNCYPVQRRGVMASYFGFVCLFKHNYTKVKRKKSNRSLKNDAIY